MRLILISFLLLNLPVAVLINLSVIRDQFSSLQSLLSGYPWQKRISRCIIKLVVENIIIYKK